MIVDMDVTDTRGHGMIHGWVCEIVCHCPP